MLPISARHTIVHTVRAQHSTVLSPQHASCCGTRAARAAASRRQVLAGNYFPTWCCYKVLMDSSSLDLHYTLGPSSP